MFAKVKLLPYLGETAQEKPAPSAPLHAQLSQKLEVEKFG
jgi:hypothetical protein